MLTYPFIFLVLMIFVSVVAVPCNMLCLPILGVLDRMRPQARSPLLLLFVAMPWLLGSGVLLSSTVDILAGACNAGEICLWNEDPAMVNGWRALLVLPLVISICAVAGRLGVQLVASRRAVTALERISQRDPDRPIHLVPSPAALAFAVRGKVFVSQGLRRALDPAQFRVMLLHEAAHLERSDAPCQMAARVLSCALLPPLRRRVLHALTLANEQACDEAAGLVEGRLTVAGAILAAERLNGPRSGLLCPGFAESFVAERVRRLMEPPPAPWRAARTYGAFVGGLLSMFLLGDFLYYIGMMVLYPGSFS